MGNDLKDRIDIRIDANLKEEFKDFCTKNEFTISDAVRDALVSYQKSKVFVETLVENLQEADFYNNFEAFLKSLSKDTRKAFEALLSSEEETLIKETSPRLLKNIRVVTPVGKAILKNRINQG